MDKRFFLALVLTAIVIVATPWIFPGANRRPATPVARASADTTRLAPTAADSGRAATAPAIQAPSAAAAN